MLDLLKKYNHYIIIALLVFTNIYAIRSCYNNKEVGNNNVIALTDSIKYYKTKSGELFVSKTLLEGDLALLKITNDSLYKKVKELKVKDPSSIIYIDNVIENPTHDTIWMWKPTENYNINRQFAFNDKYRVLEGNVFLHDSILGMNISKDYVYFDYILCVEDNEVKVKSSNPYIKYNNISGVIIPEQKHKTWGLTIGPSIYTGLNPINGKWNYGIGISATYGLRIK